MKNREVSSDADRERERGRKTNTFPLEKVHIEFHRTLHACVLDQFSLRVVTKAVDSFLTRTIDIFIDAELTKTRYCSPCDVSA